MTDKKTPNTTEDWIRLLSTYNFRAMRLHFASDFLKAFEEFARRKYAAELESPHDARSTQREKIRTVNAWKLIP